MIKFFRRVRQQVLMDLPTCKAGNRFATYLIYAFSEIVLVVIGILIALQINESYSNRLAKQKEKRILQELVVGLNEDKELLKKELLQNHMDLRALHLTDSLLDLKDFRYSSDLDTLFGKVYGHRIVRDNSAFYEDLKSSGLQLINNDYVRSRIEYLLEYNY